jgi:hypothetical protein
MLFFWVQMLCKLVDVSDVLGEDREDGAVEFS